MKRRTELSVSFPTEGEKKKDELNSRDGSMR